MRLWWTSTTDRGTFCDQQILAKRWCCSEFNCFANCARAMFVVRIYSNCIWMASSVLKRDWGDVHLLQQENHLNGVDVVFRFESMTLIETWDKIAGQCDVRGRWLCFKVVYLKLVTLQIHRTAYIFLSDTTRTYNIYIYYMYIYISWFCLFAVSDFGDLP